MVIKAHLALLHRKEQGNKLYLVAVLSLLTLSFINSEISYPDLQHGFQPFQQFATYYVVGIYDILVSKIVYLEVKPS